MTLPTHTIYTIISSPCGLNTPGFVKRGLTMTAHGNRILSPQCMGLVICPTIPCIGFTKCQSSHNAIIFAL